MALTRAHTMDWLPWLERQAAQGNEAAISALRGLRYRAQREQNKKKAGIEGEDLGKVSLQSDQANGIKGKARSDHFSIRTAQIRITVDHNVEYLDTSGNVRLTDQGPRIELTNELDRRAMHAGLLLASQKYGGEVFITGSLAFQELAAKEALELGIKVKNSDLTYIKKEPENLDELAR